jgi:hypothetical protein
MPEIIEKEVKRDPHLYGLSGKETSEQLKNITGKELKRRASGIQSISRKSNEQRCA